MALRWVNNTFIVFSLLLLRSPKWELRATGVTLITHGFSGNVTDWIIPMAGKIPQYYRFPGTNFSCYEIYVGGSPDHSRSASSEQRQL